MHYGQCACQLASPRARFATLALRVSGQFLVFIASRKKPGYAGAGEAFFLAIPRLNSKYSVHRENRLTRPSQCAMEWSRENTGLQIYVTICLNGYTYASSRANSVCARSSTASRPCTLFGETVISPRISVSISSFSLLPVIPFPAKKIPTPTK